MFQPSNNRADEDYLNTFFMAEHLHSLSLTQLLESKVERMRNLLLLIFCILLVACGKERHWPAEISSCSGCSQEEIGSVSSYVSDLNSKSGSNLVSMSNKESKTQFSITVRFVEGVEIQESGDSKNTRAGLATVYVDHCDVQLSKDLHKQENSQYFKAVLWHEMGHCAGLEHDNNEEEIMFAVTKKFPAYTDDAITRFINKFKQSARL